MVISEYDRVMLKNGFIATIVEVLEDGKAYLADIDLPDGEWDTIHVWYDDIQELVK